LFDVRSFYYILIPHDSPPFPWRCIWRSKALLRVAFFARSAVVGKILTLDNLRKWHLIVVDWCCLCKKNGETVDYHCETVSALWNSIFSLFSLAWAILHRVRDLFACWRGQFGSPQSKAVWRMIPLCWMWCIWREKNNRRF